MSAAVSAQSSTEFFEDQPRKSMSRREKKRMQKEQKQQINLQLAHINPITDNQQRTFDAFDDEKNLILHGVAGTGKTFISLYLALEAIFEERIDKPVVLIRSVVPSRDMGFLPGNITEKSAVYELPYAAMCNELFGRGDAYELLKKKGYIQFSTTSFLRGMTFRNNTVIVDECQNMGFAELDTVMTRIGEGCRVIFSGDFRQSDLGRFEDKDGLLRFMKIIDHMPSFERIEFDKRDIVRSDLVRQYIEAKLQEGLT